MQRTIDRPPYRQPLPPSPEPEALNPEPEVDHGAAKQRYTCLMVYQRQPHLQMFWDLLSASQLSLHGLGREGKRRYRVGSLCYSNVADNEMLRMTKFREVRTNLG